MRLHIYIYVETKKLADMYVYIYIYIEFLAHGRCSLVGFAFFARVSKLFSLPGQAFSSSVGLAKDKAFIMHVKALQKVIF